MKSLVSTLSDCGMLTSGVLDLVATGVLLAYTPPVPVFASCDGPNSLGLASGCTCRAACWRCVAEPAPALRTGAPELRFASGAVTLIGGNSELGFASAEACAAAWTIPAARIAIALPAKRNRRPPNLAGLIALAAAIERRDVAFSVVIDPPQPACNSHLQVMTKRYRPREFGSTRIRR